MMDLRQARELRRLQQEIGTLDGEPIADRLRRWRGVRSPDISTAQVEHRAEWADAFARESQRVIGLLGRDDVRIHHLGSTSIPGMRSKPILDIAIAVPDADAAPARDAVARCLASEGYADWGGSPMAEGTRWYWRLDHGDRPLHRVVHVCAAGEVWLASALDFRDYLRARPERRVAYEALKRELSQEADAGLAVYTLRKALLMYTIIQEARAWREDLARCG